MTGIKYKLFYLDYAKYCSSVVLALVKGMSLKALVILKYLLVDQECILEPIDETIQANARVRKIISWTAFSLLTAGFLPLPTLPRPFFCLIFTGLFC